MASAMQLPALPKAFLGSVTSKSESAVKREAAALSSQGQCAKDKHPVAYDALREFVHPPQHCRAGLDTGGTGPHVTVC